MTQPAASGPVDLVVLGGGSGGYAAALRAAELGMTVVMVERDKVGGTCLHRGCIPTKALLHAAETVDVIKEAAQFGVNGTFERSTSPAVNAYKDKVVEGLYKGLTGLVKSRKIEIVQGTGNLVSPTTVEVDGRASSRAGTSLLATGSVPQSLPGLEIDHQRVITSDDALGFDRVPTSVVILGAGAIGCEFASRLALVRRRGDDRRGAAAPGAARGGVVLQAAGAGVPQARASSTSSAPGSRRQGTPTPA